MFIGICLVCNVVLVSSKKTNKQKKPFSVLITVPLERILFLLKELDLSVFPFLFLSSSNIECLLCALI